MAKKKTRKKVKKMAFVAGGWHYPKHFYEMIAAQKVPPDWKVDLFCIGHRDPPGLTYEKQEIWDKENTGNVLYELDRILYKEFAKKSDLKKLGWKYKLEENTIGDFEFLNQWLARNDWKKYDIIATSHDDNLLVSKNLFKDVLSGEARLFQKDPKNGEDNIPAKNKNWLILDHAPATTYYHIRCTLDFFKREVIEMAGGKFDSSSITLKRRGEINTPTSHTALSDWNKWTEIMINFIEKNKLKSKVKFLSPYYRVSPYCIECERGFIHRTGWAGQEFINGINELIRLGIIKMLNTSGDK
jgi:hypothetical protein